MTKSKKLLKNGKRRKSKKAIRAAVEKVITNQMRDNDPPETNITYKRLIREEWSREDAHKLVAQCVVIEIFMVMKYHKEFNQTRFVKNLLNLPAEPWED